MSKILITGATGFVGTEVTRLLLGEGHEVICAVRDVQNAAKKFLEARVVHVDFVNETCWEPLLKGVETLINCTGIFYHPDKNRVWDIHFKSPCALFTAAKECGVKKLFIFLLWASKILKQNMRKASWLLKNT